MPSELLLGIILRQQEWAKKEKPLLRSTEMINPLKKNNKISNSWLEHAGIEWESVSVPRRIGFDRIKISPRVTGINWPVFERAWAKEKSKNTHHMMSAHLSGDVDQALVICKAEKRERWYSYIRICVDRCVFVIRHSSLPGRLTDDCVFEIFVPLMRGKEFLGNLKNQSCSEKQDHVRTLFRKLHRKYGIICSEELACMRDIELNVSICLNGWRGTFKDPVEWLQGYQSTIQGFTCNSFTKSSSTLLLNGCDTDFEETVPDSRKISFAAVSKTRIMKVYDKTYELKKEYKRTVKDDTELDMDEVTRIEVQVLKRDEIFMYLKKDNFFALTQNDIEEAFTSFLRRHLAEPLNEYYREMDRAMEKYFGSIDMHNRAWKYLLYRDLLSVISDRYYEIIQDDLRRWITYINGKSVKGNGARIFKSLVEMFKENEERAIRLVDKRSHEALIEWLVNLTGEQKQMIRYRII
ncbi:MAG: hypothetical protein K6G45_05540 [Lachnospiraceae bacterium]|nr:hypothetical protein [Lachnospiraceae bacterium]